MTKDITILSRKEAFIILHNNMLQQLVAIEIDLKHLIREQTLSALSNPNDEQNILMFQKKIQMFQKELKIAEEFILEEDKKAEKEKN